MLSQIQADDTERVVAYGSRSLQPPEKNYCTTRLEMLALLEFTDHFRYYLLGRKFQTRFYHHALKWLQSFKEPQGQVARWLERLQEYDFEVEHRVGRAHFNADAMSSRRPVRRRHGECPSCGVTKSLLTATVSKPVTVKLDIPEFIAEVASAQLTDPDIASVTGWLKQSNSKPDKKKLQSMNPVARALWAKYELLSLKDGVLYLLPAASNNKNWKPRIVLPETLIMSTLERLHGGIEGGHLWRFKTSEEVTSQILATWPSICSQ